MTINVGPDLENWTHHFKLSGFDNDWVAFELGLTAIGRDGTPDITSIRRLPYPKTNVRSNSGDGEFSVLRPPYGEFTRSDWSGGIGSVSGDDDSTKYYMGERIWSVVPKQLSLAPNLFSGHQLFPVRDGNDPELTYGTGFYKLAAGDVLAWKAVVAYDVIMYEVLIRAYEPGTITFTLRADGTDPGAVSDTVTTSDVRIGSHWYQFAVSKAAATYWMAVSANIQIEVGGGAWKSFTTKVYDLATTTWATTTAIIPAFRMHSATSKASDWLFFRYKAAAYAISGQRMFINGDRGTCDDNTGHLDQLIDATKDKDGAGTGLSTPAWLTADLWKDAYVHILGTDMWRKITASSTTGVLTVTPNWDRVLTTADNYVILGNERWTEISGSGVPGFTADVKDACVSADGVVYFAQGGTVQLRKMREYNNAGVWTRDWASESTAGTYPGADFLCASLDQEDGAVIWRAVNADNGSLSKAKSAAWSSTVNLSWGTAVKLGSDSGSAITGMCDMGAEIAVTKQEGLYFIKNDITVKGTIDMSQQYTWYTGRRPSLVTPFLIIPFGGRIQRYYNEVCESFGPEMNGGVPSEYEGDVMDSKPLLSDCIMVKDGGDAASYYQGANGGMYLYRAGGWHPLGFTGMGNRMKGCWYERVDSGMDSLWVGDKNGLYFMSMPRGYDYTRDPKYNTSKRLAPDGWMITGWFDTGRLQVDKWWDFLTLYCNNTANTSVKVYYQVSNGDESETANLAADWYYAGEAGGTGRTAANYATRIGINTNGRRIRFMFLLVGNCTDTPIIEGYSVSYVSKDDDAVSWNFMVRMGDLSYNLAGTPNDYTAGKTARDLIEYLARTVTPVTMRSIIEEWDNITVTLQRPLETVAEITPEGKEAVYLNITILSVEEPTEPPLPLVWCDRGGYHTYFPVTADHAPFTPASVTGDDVATFVYDCTLRANYVAAGYRSKFYLYGTMEEDTTGTAGEILTLSMNYPGQGYAVNDEITIVQAGGESGVVKVLTVSPTVPGDPTSGAILTYSLKDGGMGYEPATGLPTTGSATGADATFDILTVDNSWIEVNDITYMTIVAQAKTGSDATATINSFNDHVLVATWPGGVDPLDIESVTVTLAATISGTRRRITFGGGTSDALIVDACPYL